MPDRLLFGDPVELLIASPLHLLVLLIILCVVAFRAPPASRLRRWRVPLAVLLAWAWVTMTPALAHMLATQLERAYSYPDTASMVTEGREPLIIVLASGDRFNHAIPDSRQLDQGGLRRVIAAVDLSRETGGQLLMVGSGYRGERHPLAERMAQLARDLGVAPVDVRAVPGSLNTYENLEQLDPRLLEGRQVFLVTSAFHLPRAVAVARKQQLDVIPVPCDYRAKPEVTWRAWLPQNGAWQLLKIVLHERVGLLYYKIRGWA